MKVYIVVYFDDIRAVFRSRATATRYANRLGGHVLEKAVR